MLPKKKILISCSAPGSLIQFRGKLIEELLKENIVYVFTPQITDEKMRVKLTQMGIEIHENTLQRNNITITSDLKYLMALSKVIRLVKPDVFFSYTFKPLIFGSVMASLFRVKNKVAMLTGLGYNFTDTAKSFPKTVTQKLLKFSLKFNRDLKIVFQNDDDYRELLSKNIIDQKSNTYVVNGSGVDLDFYTYTEPDIDNLRFLLIARLIKAKGVEEFYEAIKIIHSKYPSVKFSVVGTFNETQIDSINPDLYQEIINSDFIDYTGWVDDVRPYIQNAAVVVLPSYREGTPRSVLEGMAMGRAIITTDTAGCRQTINNDPNSPNGYLVPVKDVAGLVSRMESFIQDPPKAIQYGINGRNYAKQKFDVHQVNKQMLQILLPTEH
ncbi:glycosyltransferase family 4 protein [Daejeonella oryzae]|uniref:glycosyltransferase family 4 protein n=1 Tax=Daejeonella oryzae TaxID=1122943 RepID=UPI000420AC22|nr:glycosyltransferase family 4 protein [Daejeonella oryzae]